MRGFFRINNEEYSDNNYVKCDGYSCIIYDVPNILGNECSVIGDLVKNKSEVKFCVSNSNLAGFSTNDTKSNYIIKNTKNNIFTNENKEDYIMVSVTNDSITLTDISDCKYLYIYK